MNITVTIEDGSPELEELQYVVSHVNSERAKEALQAGRPAPVPLTVGSYITPIVLAHLAKRVKQIYIGHAQGQTPAVLMDKFGTLADVRNT